MLRAAGNGLDGVRCLGRSVSGWWVVEEEINRNTFECFLGNKLGHGNESDPGLEEK